MKGPVYLDALVIISRLHGDFEFYVAKLHVFIHQFHHISICSMRFLKSLETCFFEAAPAFI